MIWCPQRRGMCHCKLSPMKEYAPEYKHENIICIDQLDLRNLVPKWSKKSPYFVIHHCNLLHTWLRGTDEAEVRRNRIQKSGICCWRLKQLCLMVLQLSFTCPYLGKYYPWIIGICCLRWNIQRQECSRQQCIFCCLHLPYAINVKCNRYGRYVITLKGDREK